MANSDDDDDDMTTKMTTHVDASGQVASTGYSTTTTVSGSQGQTGKSDKASEKIYMFGHGSDWKPWEYM